MDYHLNEHFKMLNNNTHEVRTLTNIIIDKDKPSDVQESNIFESLFELKYAFQEELASLSGEQLACLSNLFALILIFGCMTSITSVLYGEYLIKYFKIEDRFPKIAKFINFRRKMNNYYLIGNFIFIYLIIFIYVTINLFMFITYK